MYQIKNTPPVTNWLENTDENSIETQNLNCHFHDRISEPANKEALVSILQAHKKTHGVDGQLFQLDIVNNESHRLFALEIFDVFAQVACPLNPPITAYHWGTTESANAILNDGTGPGLERGLGNGLCGRGVYVQVADANGNGPPPNGEAVTSNSAERLKISLPENVRVLHSRNAELGSILVDSGLTDGGNAADDLMNFWCTMDCVLEEESQKSDNSRFPKYAPLLIVMSNSDRVPASLDDHQPGPNDCCVIKFPIANGENGVTIAKG
jgi:hypothetical protein